MRWLWLVVLGAAGCSRCAASSRDAGVDAAVRQVRRSTDLKIALIQAYPEYRDTALLDAEARVTRTIPGLTDAARDEALSKLKWAAAEDGGWALNKFRLAQPSPETLELSLPLSVDDVGHLYLAPTGLSSMEMALYLPRGLPVGEETFSLDLHYASSPLRSRQLVRQAVTLLIGNQQWQVSAAPPQWGPDAAGDEALPEQFSVEVTSVDTSRITFERVRGQVWVRYRLQTVGPPG